LGQVLRRLIHGQDSIEIVEALTHHPLGGVAQIEAVAQLVADGAQSAGIDAAVRAPVVALVRQSGDVHTLRAPHTVADLREAPGPGVEVGAPKEGQSTAAEGSVSYVKQIGIMSIRG